MYWYIKIRVIRVPYILTTSAFHIFVNPLPTLIHKTITKITSSEQDKFSYVFCKGLFFLFYFCENIFFH